MKGKLNGLDLFSGIGGNSIALKDYVRTIAYCERDKYAQAVLLSRMREGALSKCPIWDDVTTLSRNVLGDVEIDIIIAGFPCQDISVAGNGQGLEGQRSGLVFQIFRLIDEVKPRFVFLENVPAIRTRGGERVVKELASRGFSIRWDTLSAFDVGASHKRERWFLLATNPRNGGLGKLLQQEQVSRSVGPTDAGSNGEVQFMADAQGVGRSKGRSESEVQCRGNDLTSSGQNVADSSGKGLEGIRLRAGGSKPQEPEYASSGATSGREFGWEPEPDICRVVNGLPFRVDRIRCLGNAVVPAQAREAFKRLMGLK